jgi:hypothetical protein
VDHAPLDVAQLREVMELLTSEDIRFVPVIACAFADQDLELMYKTFLPADIPGGKKRMIGRFGPISSLFSRIQFAHAFDMGHSDILIALDKLREHRNTISHSWNPAEFADFFEAPLPHMDEIESALLHSRHRYGDDTELSTEASLRVRTIWLLARLFYETRFYSLAKMAQIKPLKALYGINRPKTLGTIAEAAQHCTGIIFDKG